ncbi:MAG: DUF445 family protein [Candidatus Binataceae bacterium]
MSERKHGNFRTFLERNKGNVALTLSFILYVISWPLTLLNHQAAAIVRAAGEASLVGGLCDYIALNMIFERHWYLPNSGVLPRNREKLIDGIANTIEREWLTPTMIGQKLHELRLLDRLGDYLRGASLKRMVRHEQLEHLCNDAARYLEPEFLSAFIDRISSQMGPTGLIDRLRTAFAKAVVWRACERVRKMVVELPRNDELMGTVDTAIHEIGVHLHDEQSALRKTADYWMESLVGETVVASRGEIARMVKQNLSRLSDEAIRIQIETRTRTHLDWIRVNGGVFGALLGCVFALLNALNPQFHALTQHIASSL